MQIITVRLTPIKRINKSGQDNPISRQEPKSSCKSLLKTTHKLWVSGNI